MDMRAQLQDAIGPSFRVEQELGGAGMSRVFVAVDSSLGRNVVVKVLPPEMAAAVRLDRFRREIQLAANLQHPHIVPLLAAGETNGLPYYMMPFVQGESLRQRLQREGELPIRDAIRILREVASALSHAHHNGIVHRDIKPENVLISGGAAVVTDFGVAKALASSGVVDPETLTSIGMTLGTPAYMAPEQVSADRMTDHRADLYALGVMGYELVSGTTPFVGSSAQAVMAAHLVKKPEVLSERRENVPTGLVTLIMSCLAKKPADRIQTADEVVRLLDDIPASGSELSPVTASATQPSSFLSRKLWLSTSLAALILLLAVVAAKWSGERRPQIDTSGERRQQIDMPLAWKGVDAAVQRYAHAIESRDVREVKTVAPGLTLQQLENWREFFASTPKIDAVFRVRAIQGSDSLVNVTVEGAYRYAIPISGVTTPEDHPFSFIATLQGKCPNGASADCGDKTVWTIASVGGSMVR